MTQLEKSLEELKDRSQFNGTSSFYMSNMKDTYSHYISQTWSDIAICCHSEQRCASCTKSFFWVFKGLRERTLRISAKLLFILLLENFHHMWHHKTSYIFFHLMMIVWTTGFWKKYTTDLSLIGLGSGCLIIQHQDIITFQFEICVDIFRPNPWLFVPNIIYLMFHSY